MSMAESPQAISWRGSNRMNGVDEILQALEHSRFYGSVEIKYEAGRVVLLRKTETIKPDYRDTRGNNDEHDT